MAGLTFKWIAGAKEITFPLYTRRSILSVREKVDEIELFSNFILNPYLSIYVCSKRYFSKKVHGFFWPLAKMLGFC